MFSGYTYVISGVIAAIQILFLDPVKYRHIDDISVIRPDFSIDFTEFFGIKSGIPVSQRFSVRLLEVSIRTNHLFL